MSEQVTHLVIMRRWVNRMPKLSYHGTIDKKLTLCDREIGKNVMLPIIGEKTGITCFECRYVLRHGVKYGIQNE